MKANKVSQVTHHSAIRKKQATGNCAYPSLSKYLVLCVYFVLTFKRVLKDVR